jgi:ribonucleases P/MRP protein subunit RPP40
VGAHGITGDLLRWIRNWLTHRRQWVVINGEFSQWNSVASGVLQGSILGPILFLIYINDLEQNLTSTVIKFADDTNVYGCVTSKFEAQVLQNDLDLLATWSHTWQMLFNEQNCKVMHIGRTNLNSQYTLNGITLTVTDEQRDLGVVMLSSLKASSQCRAAHNKASRALGMMKRTLNTRRHDILLRLYKTLVRPHLEFCTPAWSVHYKMDAQLLERVQHRFTKMIPKLARLPYNERLNRLGITTLEERRNRADLIEMYKMYRGLSTIPFSRFFQLDDTAHRTRGHMAKVLKIRCYTTVRLHFLSARVINRWNQLTEDVVEATSLNLFKSRLLRLCNIRKGFLLDCQSANLYG